MSFYYRLLIFIALFSTSGYARSEYAVIIHRDNKASIDRNDIAKIFLGKSKKFSNGARALPINLPDESDSKMQFDNWFLGKSPSQMKSHWSIVILTGKSIPIKTVESDLEVVDIVSQNPEAIGYVDAINTDERVKVLFHF